jgi:hypothetical protein
MSLGQPSPHQPQPPPQPAWFAGVLSYLVPGLGQISQGRFGKGVMFMVILLAMFIYGQALGGWRNVFMPLLEENDKIALPKPLASVYNRWHYAGQFWIGIAAWPAIWQFYGMPVPAEEQHPFWHNLQRPPDLAGNDERELNAFYTDSDKTPDLGWVYTVIAGMLNILVIYDAIMGPAFPARRSEEESGPTATTEGAAS